MVCYTRTSSCPAKRPLMYVNWTESTLNSLLSWSSAAPAPAHLLNAESAKHRKGRRSKVRTMDTVRPVFTVKTIEVSEVCTSEHVHLLLLFLPLLLLPTAPGRGLWSLYMAMCTCAGPVRLLTGAGGQREEGTWGAWWCYQLVLGWSWVMIVSRSQTLIHKSWSAYRMLVLQSQTVTHGVWSHVPNSKSPPPLLLAGSWYCRSWCRGGQVWCTADPEW